MMMDKPITLDELRRTLMDCKESAPGPDGIPYLVYKECWEVFGPIILDSWNYCKAEGKLQEFNRHSSITLIPKEGKDPRMVGNWRPITLTNCDLKIFTKLLANRVSKILPKILIDTQVAYVPGRSVHDNLRMFEFFNEYCKKQNVDAVLISLDAAKAFDSVDHKYMFETLRRYGFSEEFIDTVRMLYNDLKAEILVNGYRSVLIRIRRGVKQGDALSCALFIICLDPVLRNIERSNKIKGIEIKTPLSNRSIKSKIGGYADDVGTVVKNDSESINNVFKVYAKFSSYSGLKLNEEKSEIMSLNRGGGNFVPITIKIDSGYKKFELKTVESIKICGVNFSTDKDIANKFNVVEKIVKMEKNLIAWIHKGLSPLGKIVIINTFGISQLIYTMQMCEYREQDLKRVEEMIFKFLWSKKWNGNKAPDRIKRDIVKQNYSEGGLKVPDIKSLNSALKLKQFFRAIEASHLIRIIQKYVTEKGDYDFVYQQEYSRITEMENVVRTAQMTINCITDKMREVLNVNSKIEYINLIACLDVVEYLEKKGHALALCHFKRLFRLGIEKFIHLVRESKYPRSDQISNIANLVLKSFPREWVVLMDNEDIDEDITLINNIPLGKSRLYKISKVSVKVIKWTILGRKVEETAFPYHQKLGIRNHENINPFIVAQKVNHSVNLRFFKYRLLHCDIYTKERMARFKMVENDRCDYCGRREDIAHMIWECDRAKQVWAKINDIFVDFDRRGCVTFESIFVGFAPTIPVLESVITKITRMIMTRDRSELLVENVIKHELKEHCICNIYRLKIAKQKPFEWERLNSIVDNNFNV